MYLDLEINNRREINLDEYLVKSNEYEAKVQVNDGDSDKMDVDIHSEDEDINMLDYLELHGDSDDEPEDETFQISTSTIHDDGDMELPSVNEKELLEDSNYIFYKNCDMDMMIIAKMMLKITNQV